MLGGGTLLIIIGNYIAFRRKWVLGSTPAPPIAFTFLRMWLGLLSMVGNIPLLFILSGKNKEKAKAMVGSTYYPNPTAPTHLKTMTSAGI